MANRQIFELTGRSLALTDVTPTQDAAGVAEAGKSTIQEVKNLIMPYKVYTAKLNQSGTGIPVATILENTLPGTPVFSRTGVGDYLFTLAGVFLAAKVYIPTEFLFIDNGSNFAKWQFFRIGDNALSIITTAGPLNTLVAVDDLLIDTHFEVRVYN